MASAKVAAVTIVCLLAIVLTSFAAAKPVRGLGGAPAAPVLLKSCSVGGMAQSGAYDPVNHLMYIPSSYGSKITLLASNCTIVRTIYAPASSAPFAAAFDPIDKEVYVTDFILNAVYLLNSTAIVHSLSNNFSTPVGIAFDPKDRSMFIGNAGGHDVTIVRGTKVLGQVQVGSGPDGIAYDPKWSVMLVADSGGSNVTTLSAVAPQTAPHGSIPVGSQPSWVAYDPADGYDYVTDGSSSNVSVVSGNGSVIGSVAIPVLSGAGGQPYGVAFSPKRSSMYVSDYMTSTVWVIKGLNRTSYVNLTAGRLASPTTPIYDPTNGHVFVPDSTHGRVYDLT